MSVINPMKGWILSDRNRLMTLMSLVPWDDAEAADELFSVVDSDRWSLLINGLIDYRTARDTEKYGDPVDRLSVYVLDVFEGAPRVLITAVGALVADGLGLDRQVDGLAAAVGQRWVNELCSIAWQLRIDLVADRP
ncbi:hypothetical protein OOZ19_00785 [Saccharopolyspora sp. NFXS83]|uniref:hypothetical protein n=1 Tax=Saccharopolyspora sp. NFXS83 TaxID=2993560 RepID=UPI00224B6A2A|nr:hypothetical protein [Saccharopolyspora sp. NFXS83]MCX2728766.1 hypothetical protein [Saccharopolyspora sp. NFXS83]